MLRLEHLLRLYAHAVGARLGRGGTWTSRVLERILRKSIREVVNDRLWIVDGIPELGDSYPYYEVRRTGSSLSCSCFLHLWGSRRRREICTHVGAVIVLRELLHDLARFDYVNIVEFSKNISIVFPSEKNFKTVKVLDRDKTKVLILSNSKTIKFLLCSKDRCHEVGLELESTDPLRETLIRDYIGAGAGIRTRE